MSGWTREMVEWVRKRESDEDEGVTERLIDERLELLWRGGDQISGLDARQAINELHGLRQEVAELRAVGPVMPETPSEEALQAIYDAGENDCETLYAMLRAALIAETKGHD